MTEYRGTHVPFDSLVLKKYSGKPLIWGAKISEAERNSVKDVAVQVLADANDMMACIAWESGRSFSPAKKNMAGSSGTGLIQVMIDTVKCTPEIFRYCQGKMDAGFVRDASYNHQLQKAMEIIAAMSFVEYMYHVTLPYFRPYRGRIGNLNDLYMSILYPNAIGKPDDYVLFVDDTNKTRDAYDMNRGLDADGDRTITKREACAPVIKAYEEGKKWIQ